MKLWVGLAAGALLGALGMWLFLDGGRVHADVIEGTVYPDITTKTVAFFGEDGDQDGYDIAGAEWKDDQNAWHSWSTENCLEPIQGDQHVSMGIVHVEPSEEASGRDVVVWLDCLTSEEAEEG